LSRAFSIMGQYGAYSMWMGGVYENQFVKEDGIWKIKKDQVFNTYFAQYAVGWKDLVPRPPPGITATNPPDAPPTHPFEMYPRAFLPPFPYANPVTGNRVVWPCSPCRSELCSRSLLAIFGREEESRAKLAPTRDP